MKPLPLLAMILLTACAVDRTSRGSADTIGTVQSRSATCNKVAGTEILWTAKTRWIVVGELHGTVEAPQVFADLVCLASKTGRPVVVGLERNETEQPVLDTYLASTGSEGDRAALLSHPSWQNGRDGRSSRAMVDLIEVLRRLKQKGAISRVTAFQPAIRGAQADREAAMADRLTKASSSEATLVIALVGNLHAMKTKQTFVSNSFVPAAGYLPPASTFSIDLRGNGGGAWNCSPECQAHYSLPRSPATPRGLVTVTGSGQPFDGVFHLGRATTASPPAVTQ
jgi:hypothetical protein